MLAQPGVDVTGLAGTRISHYNYHFRRHCNNVNTRTQSERCTRQAKIEIARGQLGLVGLTCWHYRAAETQQMSAKR